jgi:hypothetical protein
MAILTGVRWNLSVVLICIAFMAKDGEHFDFYIYLYIFAKITWLIVILYRTENVLSLGLYFLNFIHILKCPALNQDKKRLF